MRIYEKSVSFVRANQKFGAKLAIIWGNERCKPLLQKPEGFRAKALRVKL
jgi:hypothetical protein